MIELDLFGSWGKAFIEELKSKTGALAYFEPCDYSFLRIEEVESISEDYRKREFAGRISFYDEDSSSVKELFLCNSYGLLGDITNSYDVVKGYFPPHIPYDLLDFDDSNTFGDSSLQVSSKSPDGKNTTLSFEGEEIAEIEYLEDERVRLVILKRKSPGLEEVLSAAWDEIVYL